MNTPEDKISQPETNFPTLWIALLLAAIPTIFYWRHDLFFMWDDWTELDFMANKPFLQYLMTPDGEIFFPIFHLFFYFLVKLSGERHALLVLVNCLASGITAFLLYLLLKKNLTENLAMVLSLVYAGSVVQQAIVWNAFYLCYILSLMFFLLALLSIDRYLQSSSLTALVLAGLFSFLSIHSHNFTLFSLFAIPGYAALKGGAPDYKKKIVHLLVMVTGIVGFFILEYFSFAGTKATTIYSHGVYSSFPGFGFVLHWFYGAFLSPLIFLLFGHYKVPVLEIILGVAFLLILLFLVFFRGKSPEKRLGLWALGLNGLPFALVSFGRYQLGPQEAYAVRYNYFTLLGMLLLIGTAWTIFQRNLPKRISKSSVIFLLLLAITLGQVLSLPAWKVGYLRACQQAISCYGKPDLLNDSFKLWGTPHYPLKQQQIEDIKHFLKEGRRYTQKMQNLMYNK